MSQDYESFKIWYIEPLRKLEEMPSGQGGFIALATSCFLFERYAVAILNSQGKKADRAGKVGQLSKEFSIDIETANTFWNVIRNGMLHQGMPLHNENLLSCSFHHTYPAIALIKKDGGRILIVQPWKFTDRVLELWINNIHLIKSSGSFPWAAIGPVPTYEDSVTIPQK